MAHFHYLPSFDAPKQRIQKLETENKELRMKVEVVYGELHLISKNKEK